MRMSRWIAAAAGAALAVSLAACASGSEEPGDRPETGGVDKILAARVGSMADAAIFLGIEQGYFAEANIELETTVVSSPPAGIPAVQSGEVDMAYAPSVTILTAAEQNVDVRIIAPGDGYPDEGGDVSMYDTTGIYIMPDSGIARAKDLEGKRVAIPARSDQLEINLAKIIRDDGGDPGTVQWVLLDFATAASTLASGDIDAAALVVPFTAQAEENGGVLFASPAAEFFEHGAIGAWVTNSKHAENTDLMKRLHDAIVKSNTYANEHPDEALEKAAELTGIDLETLKQGARPYWSTTVKPEDFERAGAQMLDLGFLTNAVEVGPLMISGLQ